MASAQTEQRHPPVGQSVSMPMNPILQKVPPTVDSSALPITVATTASPQSSATDAALRPKSTQAPILEEDESTASGSETAEPITPTSESSHNRFHHHGEVVAADSHIPSQYAAEASLKPLTPIQPLPQQAPLEPQISVTSSPAASTPRASVPRPQSMFVQKSLPDPPPPPRKSPSQSSNEDLSTTPKGGIGKRVGTFVKNKLSRTASSKNRNSFILDGTADSPVDAPVDSPTPTPKPKRISSFSFSARNSPNTSKTNSGTNTPPSPNSPTDAVEDDNELEKSQTYAGIGGHGHSQSSSGIARMGSPRTGITWGNGITSSGRNLQVPRPNRRRSASTDQIPIIRQPEDEQEADPTDGLRISYSKMAVAGAGLKARRLSTSLPDEFWVDYCELEKEFKSSSIFPGRRGHLVGKGATATVTLMQRRGGSKEELYAVKEFRGKDKAEREDEYIQKVKSEYSIAKSLHHPNIVETVRLCVQHGRWNHVMEYCQVGELYTLVEKGFFRTHYKLEDRLCFFKQIARGIDYLHSHGIAHRDIKLENLLMTSEGHIKITDFGVSEVFCGEHPGLRQSGGQCGKNMAETRRCAPGICGSLPYIAPEVLEKKGDYDPRPLDVWSCAIVFLTMTYSGSPWQAAKPEYQHYAKFAKGWSDWLAVHPDGIINDGVEGTPKCGPVFSRLDSAPLKRLMLKMLHPDPEKRITIGDALRGGLLKSVDCCSPETFEEVEQRGYVDATSKKSCKISKVLKKHTHLPPREHKTPKALQHRFDMGDGYTRWSQRQHKGVSTATRRVGTVVDTVKRVATVVEAFPDLGLMVDAIRATARVLAGVAKH